MDNLQDQYARREREQEREREHHKDHTLMPEAANELHNLSLEVRRISDEAIETRVELKYIRESLDTMQASHARVEHALTELQQNKNKVEGMGRGAYIVMGALGAFVTILIGGLGVLLSLLQKR